MTQVVRIIGTGLVGAAVATRGAGIGIGPIFGSPFGLIRLANNKLKILTSHLWGPIVIKAIIFNLLVLAIGGYSFLYSNSWYPILVSMLYIIAFSFILLCYSLLCKEEHYEVIMAMTHISSLGLIALLLIQVYLLYLPFKKALFYNTLLNLNYNSPYDDKWEAAETYVMDICRRDNPSIASSIPPGRMYVQNAFRKAIDETIGAKIGNNEMYTKILKNILSN